MKRKKILLFILILFFILIIHNNCKGVIVEEGGIGKYYLSNLPNEDNEFYNTTIFVKNDNSKVFLLQYYNSYDLGYDLVNNKFSLYLKSNKSLCNDMVNDGFFKFYEGTLTEVNEKFICSSWSSYIFGSGISQAIVSGFKAANFNFLYGNSFYPCIGDFIINDLNNFADWNDDIIIAGSSDGNIGLFVPTTQFKDYVYSYSDSLNPGYAVYRTSVGGSIINLNYYKYNIDTLSFEFIKKCSSTNAYPYASFHASFSFLFLNKNFLNNDTGDIILNNTKYFFNFSMEDVYSVFPYILNSAEDLSKGNDDIVIMPGDFSSTEDINFVIQKIETKGEGDETYESYTNIFDTITLNIISDYYTETDNGGFFYVIPWSFIESKLEKDVQYSYVLSYSYNNKTYTKDLFSTYGGLSESDIIHNTINEQTKVFEEYYKKQETLIQEQTKLQEEQNETSKGIWGALKEVLSYINPFSENFFVYKLIDLLIDALKSLFIPDNDFLTNYFNELKEWFSDKLGFLSYPLELILDILDKIKNINFSEPIIQIPDFIEPSTNEKIIAARTYNLNSLLENDTFKTCHDVYFILVDAIIIFGLVNLLKHKLEEVFTK